MKNNMLLFFFLEVKEKTISHKIIKIENKILNFI